MGLSKLTIKQAGDKLSKGEITSVELTEAVFERIEAVESRVGAYITSTRDKALEMAKESDKRRKNGKSLSELDGIPVAVKDLFLTKGVKTTAGSKILEDFIPPYESTVTKKLWQAGAVLVGKTNLDEFAMGSSTETSAYKTAKPLKDDRPAKGTVPSGDSPWTTRESTTRNPWDLSRVPGGSSGGSAAAVAADECLGAIGTDTGGSIRQPAAFCGVTGLKPTYGRVSRSGIIAMASSLDQAGPMVKSVEDAAIILKYMSGHDKYDATSSDHTVTAKGTVPSGDSPHKRRKAKGESWKVGVPAEFFGRGMDEDVEKVVREGIKQLEKMGAKIVPVSLPMSKYALAVYYILMPAEVSSNLARYDGIRFGLSVLKAKGDPTSSFGLCGTRRRKAKVQDSILDVYLKGREAGFGAEAKRRIMLGSYVLSAGYYDAYYRKAQRVRTLIKKEFDNIFKSVDLLATPVSPTPAFKFGDKSGDPLAMYMSDIMTVPVNPAGLPALSIPAGFVKCGNKDLPVGMQLIGPMWSESTLLGVGHAFQQETDWHLRKPSL